MLKLWCFCWTDGVLVKYMFFLHLQNLAQIRLLHQHEPKDELVLHELVMEREALVRKNERALWFAILFLSFLQPTISLEMVFPAELLTFTKTLATFLEEMNGVGWGVFHPRPVFNHVCDRWWSLIPPSLFLSLPLLAPSYPPSPLSHPVSYSLFLSLSQHVPLGYHKRTNFHDHNISWVKFLWGLIFEGISSPPWLLLIFLCVYKFSWV